MKLLFAIFLFVATASAQEINLVQIPGYLSIPQERVPQLILDASKYFHRVGIVFRIRQIEDESECLKWHSYQFLELEAECLRDEAKRHGILTHRKKTLVYYLLPPWITVDKRVDEGGTQSTIIGGAALGICNRFAIGAGTEEELPASPVSFEEAVVTFAHEIFHLMCATHVSFEKNLMHPYALDYVKPGKLLKIENITRRQVLRWYAQFRKSHG